MLAYLGLSLLTAWQFAFISAVAVAVFFVWRVALNETPRIKIDNFETYNEGDITWWRVKIRNISGRDIDGIKISLVNMKQFTSPQYKNQIDLPLILLTQQAMRRSRQLDEASHGPEARTRFSLAAYDAKNIELLQLNNKRRRIEIRHETGEYHLLKYDTLFEYKILGGGNELHFYLKFLYSSSNRKFIIFPIQDNAMLLALENLGNSGWWESERSNGTR